MSSAARLLRSYTIRDDWQIAVVFGTQQQAEVRGEGDGWCKMSSLEGDVSRRRMFVRTARLRVVSVGVCVRRCVRTRLCTSLVSSRM